MPSTHTHTRLGQRRLNIRSHSVLFSMCFKLLSLWMKSYGVGHSNETSSAVLSHGTVYLVCSSNFRVGG